MTTTTRDKDISNITKIVAGLLASGHYTKPADPSADEDSPEHDPQVMIAYGDTYACTDVAIDIYKNIIHLVDMRIEYEC